MAFVFRSERDDIAGKSNPVLGPGTYIGHSEKFVAPAYAPFNSM